MKISEMSEGDLLQYRAELAYAVTHPEEEELTADQLAAAKKELSAVKSRLAHMEVG